MRGCSLPACLNLLQPTFQHVNAYEKKRKYHTFWSGFYEKPSII